LGIKKEDSDRSPLVYKVILRKKPKTAAPMGLRTDKNNSKPEREKKHLFSEPRNFALIYPFNFNLNIKDEKCQYGA
jgi:hypothetical protein